MWLMIFKDLAELKILVKELADENIKLRKENYELNAKVKEMYYTIQQYEEWFANGSWHWDDEF